MGSQSLSLDTIISSALFFSAKWEPSLKRSQSRDVLRLIIAKMYPLSNGNLFHTKIRASHAALGDALDLSREWVCRLVARLRDSGWVRTEAPRLPDGTQEVTIFRAGRTLKRLLVMLLKSKQRQTPHNSRVNDPLQKIPTKEQVEKQKAFLADLVRELSQKLSL